MLLQSNSGDSTSISGSVIVYMQEASNKTIGNSYNCCGLPPSSVSYQTIAIHCALVKARIRPLDQVTIQSKHSIHAYNTHRASESLYPYSCIPVHNDVGYQCTSDVTTVMVILRESHEAMVEFAITRTFSYQCEWTVLGTY